MSKVSRVIDAHAFSEKAAVYRGKAALGHLRKIMIPSGDLRPGKADLSRRAAGKQVAVPVQDQGPGVWHRPADGDVRVLVLIYHMVGGTDRELGRAVSVDDLNIRLLDGQELLSAHHQIMQREAVVGIQHRHSHLCRQRETDDLMLLEILMHTVHIPAKLV